MPSHHIDHSSRASGAPRPTVAARAAALWLLTTAVAASIAVALLPLSAGPQVNAGGPFETLLSETAAVALLGCAAWAWVVTTAVLLEAVTAGPAPLALHRRGLPSAYRRLLLGACGVAMAAVTSAPALATPGPVSVPAVEHVAAPGAARAPMHPRAAAIVPQDATETITVRRGDSLWDIAARRLAADAPAATIDHAWRRLYEANIAVVGGDPDHIVPGQRLARPRAW